MLTSYQLSTLEEAAARRTWCHRTIKAFVADMMILLRNIGWQILSFSVDLSDTV